MKRRGFIRHTQFQTWKQGVRKSAPCWRPLRVSRRMGFALSLSGGIVLVLLFLAAR